MTRSLSLARFFTTAALIVLQGGGLFNNSHIHAMSATPVKKVAVIGTTGKLGRQAVLQLNERKVPVRCLLRHDPSESEKPSIDKDASSSEVAAYLAALPNVEMVKGDVTDKSSVAELVKGCDAVLALHGPPRPSSVLKSLVPFLQDEQDGRHPRMVNYEGVKNIIEAARSSKTCKRIVRVTGKGEEPWSFFSILINMLGNMAKAWNYEGEELLRQCKDLDYTIVRPGVMGVPNTPEGAVLALKDNGGDLKVSPIKHETIASLCIECLEYPNAARSTLTAMNVPDGEGEKTYAPLLAKVAPDTREFPASMLDGHRAAARTGAAILLGFVAVGASVFVSIVKAALALFLK